jgi:hypothetical protein
MYNCECFSDIFHECQKNNGTKQNGTVKDFPTFLLLFFQPHGLTN